MPKQSRRMILAGAIASAALVAAGAAAPAFAETEVPEPAEFTSAFQVIATPDQVVNANSQPAPGEPGAAGTFIFRINSELEIICYDITLTGVTGDYQSPAKTATHIHEAPFGMSGPPRIAFPNPGPVGDGPRTSSGCLQGPFTTGILANGVDTGEGFTLDQIEANPTGFTGDSHTVNYVPGVVRGQLESIPLETEVPPAAEEEEKALAATGSSVPTALAPIALLAILSAVGVMVWRRRTA